MRKKIIYSGFFFTIVILFFVTFPPKAILYDDTHLEYNKYFDIISNYKEGESIDFTDFVSGDWEKLCVFGGYTNPSIYMSKLGEISSYEFIKQRLKSYSVFRLAEVEEFESTISYVDSNNSVHFVQMNTAPQMNSEFTFEHQTVCVDKHRPTIQFPQQMEKNYGNV